MQANGAPSASRRVSALAIWITDGWYGSYTFRSAAARPIEAVSPQKRQRRQRARSVSHCNVGYISEKAWVAEFPHGGFR